MSDKKTMQDLIALVPKTNRPTASQADITALQQVLRDVPTAWRIAGDLSRRARDILIGDKNVLMTESVKRGMNEMEQQLGHENATALERLLIEQIVTQWLVLQIAEIRNAAAIENRIGLAQADHLVRRLESAQRGYLRAIETLTRVRRLLRASAPMMQVNIAPKQLNVAKMHKTQMPTKIG